MRQRRNKTSTATILDETPRRRRPAPPLPDRQVTEDDDGTWDPRTVAFWKDVWSSPMAAEYLDADVHGLYILAELVDAFWRKPSFVLAAEIRQQRQCFGLTPIDRRRLQWEVARVNSTKRPKNRDPEPPTSSRRRITGDARSVLRVV
jgi:hypothetical protein